jgi:hypothetical protein
MPDKELLDEKVVFQNGPWQRIRRWWRGIHAGRGTITRGWSGWETVEERDRILPLHSFTVKGEAEEPVPAHLGNPQAA